MCRLAAYLGPELSLQTFLLDPPHGLVKQSWAPREMAEAILNADGFGFGWYPEKHKAVTYLNTQPIWSDINLAGLATSLSSHLWMACVRSATPGQMTGLNNTQPFVHDSLLFMHNGYISDFSESCKTCFNEYLRPEIRAGINGNTDSEYIFAVFRQQLDKTGKNYVSALSKTVSTIGTLAGETPVLMNIIISDGSSIHALRHAFNGKSPSLYFANGAVTFNGGNIVTSEPLNENDNWQTFPDHQILTLSENNGIQWATL